MYLQCYVIYVLRRWYTFNWKAFLFANSSYTIKRVNLLEKVKEMLFDSVTLQYRITVFND